MVWTIIGNFLSQTVILLNWNLRRFICKTIVVVIKITYEYTMEKMWMEKSWENIVVEFWWNQYELVETNYCFISTPMNLLKGKDSKYHGKQLSKCRQHRQQCQVRCWLHVNPLNANPAKWFTWNQIFLSPHCIKQSFSVNSLSVTILHIWSFPCQLISCVKFSMLPCCFYGANETDS